jgi:DNA-binding SARP family transcriptional activator/tetratricopeptide (TPR) repeat protein
VSGKTELQLLGPLAVRQDGMLVPIRPGKQQILLAALLLAAGRLVGLDELAEVMWEAAPPASARASLQTQVARLRRALTGVGLEIVTGSGGYRIETGTAELDLARFESALAAGRAAAAAGSWAEAATVLGAGLDLWRGLPLSGVTSDVLTAREVPRLSELRLQALEGRIEADLRLGRHREVVAELRQLVVAEPLRERLHGLLMTALYRDGQQAAALAAYQTARAMLVGELGVEPGGELRRLHQQVLAGELPPAPPGRPGGELAGPGGQRPEPQPRSAPGPAEVPRQLPAAAAWFAGRDGELAALTGLLDQPAAGGATVVISAIAGTAGVGKTALAVRWAHQVAGRFPDGQLYVNLRGYDPDRPMPPVDALAGFLRALGVPGPEIPAEAAERAARYRTLLAGRRVLVVLDNAGDVEQVRPLLPGAAGCAAVVTSRDGLPGLIARDGARRLDLDLLSLPEAAGLLRSLIGARADDDIAATEDLAAQCARLPLALRVAAEMAAVRASVPLADLVAELADLQRRLDHLDAGGDPRTAVRGVFSWSYQKLGEPAARAFRMAGLHPGPDLEPYAAAALAGATARQARAALDELARSHLVHVIGPGRFGMHDLLSAYARELAARQDGADERRAALTRLLDHYLHMAASAMDTLFPAERHCRPRVPAPATPGPPVDSRDAARAWLDRQRPALVAAVVHAAGNGWPSHATRLAVTLHRYLENGGHYPEAIIIHRQARRAARDAGDRAGEATALTNLGVVDIGQGRYAAAAGLFQLAVPLYHEAGDLVGAARAQHNLGVTAMAEGRYQQAADYFRPATTLYREIGDRWGLAKARTNLAALNAMLGRYEEAADHAQQALALAGEVGDLPDQAHALRCLGDIESCRGRHAEAVRYLRRSVAVSREIGHRNFEAGALSALGDVRLREGRPAAAVGHYQQALAVFGETGLVAGETEALNGLGQAFLALGRREEARAQHAQALSQAIRVGERREQARAHEGLGHACAAAGDGRPARRHWQQALTIFTELSTPEAAPIRDRLARDQLAGDREPTTA